MGAAVDKMNVVLRRKTREKNKMKKVVGKEAAAEDARKNVTEAVDQTQAKDVPREKRKRTETEVSPTLLLEGETEVSRRRVGGEFTKPAFLIYPKINSSSGEPEETETPVDIDAVTPNVIRPKKKKKNTLTLLEIYERLCFKHKYNHKIDFTHANCEFAGLLSDLYDYIQFEADPNYYQDMLKDEWDNLSVNEKEQYNDSFKEFSALRHPRVNDFDKLIATIKNFKNFVNPKLQVEDSPPEGDTKIQEFYFYIKRYINLFYNSGVDLTVFVKYIDKNFLYELGVDSDEHFEVNDAVSVTKPPAISDKSVTPAPQTSKEHTLSATGPSQTSKENTLMENTLSATVLAGVAAKKLGAISGVNEATTAATEARKGTEAHGGSRKIRTKKNKKSKKSGKKSKKKKLKVI